MQIAAQETCLIINQLKSKTVVMLYILWKKNFFMKNNFHDFQESSREQY